MIPGGVLVKSLRYCIALSFHISFAAPTLCDHCLVTKNDESPGRPRLHTLHRVTYAGILRGDAKGNNGLKKHSHLVNELCASRKHWGVQQNKLVSCSYLECFSCARKFLIFKPMMLQRSEKDVKKFREKDDYE